MKIETISTDKAPSAIGPYSQGKVLGQFVFTSGQIPINPENGEIINGGIEEQTEMSIKNLIAILNAGDSCVENVIKTTCFLSDMNDFAKFNSVYEKYFISKPARSCVAVKTLPKNVLCEIEAIAIKN